jgi:hypothetical protein
MAKIQYNGCVRGADYVMLGKLVRNDAVAMSHELGVPSDWVNPGRVGKQQADALKSALEHAVVEALKAQNALLEREPELRVREMNDRELHYRSIAADEVYEKREK